MNTIRKIIFFPLYAIVLLVNKLIHYYEKEALVTFDYINGHDEQDLPTKEIDSFRIRICAKKRCVFTSSIPFEEIDVILKALKDAPAGLQLSITHGIGEENIYIPKWAVPQIFDQLFVEKSQIN
jgi:hypothetical protein